MIVLRGVNVTPGIGESKGEHGTSARPAPRSTTTAPPETSPRDHHDQQESL